MENKMKRMKKSVVIVLLVLLLVSLVPSSVFAVGADGVYNVRYYSYDLPPTTNTWTPAFNLQASQHGFVDLGRNARVYDVVTDNPNVIATVTEIPGVSFLTGQYFIGVTNRTAQHQNGAVRITYR
jgi:hypothetical protein